MQRPKRQSSVFMKLSTVKLDIPYVTYVGLRNNTFQKTFQSNHWYSVLPLNFDWSLNFQCCSIDAKDMCPLGWLVKVAFDAQLVFPIIPPLSSLYPFWNFTQELLDELFNLADSSIGPLRPIFIQILRQRHIRTRSRFIGIRCSSF